MKRLALILAAALAISAKEKPRTVTLDVKDGEARAILRSVQQQCGIRNMIVDPDVQGSGTFFFRDVPCAQAIPVVLRVMGLAGRVQGSSVMRVEPR
ncbi:MAG TPA: hypothetical protein VF883_04305 [Thermoanaerobaculia bacterium]